MIAIAVVGLIVLAAAVALGVDGVQGNRGSGHQIPGGFDVFGRTLHGSTGQLFFWGLVVGVSALLGLMLFVAGLRGGVSRRRRNRRAAAVLQVAEVHEPKHAAEPGTPAEAPRESAEVPAPEPVGAQTENADA